MDHDLHSYRDPITGATVLRLTDPAEHCHHPYFYCRSFTPDSRQVLYVKRDQEAAEARLVDIATGAGTTLIRCRGLDEFLITLTADGRCLLYSEGPRLHRLEIGSGCDEVVWTQQAPWDGGPVYPGYSDDHRWALMAQMHRDDALPRSEGWGFFEPQWRARPRCRLTLVDLRSGDERVIREERCWLGHPQVRPDDANTLMYCHEGPGNRIDARMWLVQADGTKNRCVGYREVQPGAGAADYITHEFFMPDGQHIAYLRLPHGERDKVRVRLRRVDDLTLVRDCEVSGYLHVGPAPDGRFLAGDQRSREPASDCLWLLNLHTGAERRLCLHGSSYASRGNSTQDAHPHPTFAPDGRAVLFTSDRETGSDGPCAVYLAFLPEE